ncbi:hypothetical protein GFJ94_00535 [Flavobacterium sp. LMO8]|uniref:hypothetical protein n=1 Tax=Flavobacterium sp. LMO8 TaxID=2654244 RepID=UPI00129251AF|nr:hypothetical protein [Flavobacterium sp. LMO8]MQP23547.1 hypothetical protein [Flavobacterium sp. LMO8]
MIRYLLISAFFSLFISCKSYQIKDAVSVDNSLQFVQNQYFSDSSLDYVYKTHIEIYGNKMGGIFIAKRINDSIHRMVLTTDFGNKLLDFEISESSFKVNFVIDNLDKKIIINTLRDDFRTLLQVNSKVFKTYKRNNEVIYQTENNVYYFFDEFSNNLTKIIKTNKRKEKVLFTFQSKKTTFAENINIQHNNIKLKIDFNQINN